jgi:hypothetical protein
VVAKVRYISHRPVTIWKNPSARSPGLFGDRTKRAVGVNRATFPSRHPTPSAAPDNEREARRRNGDGRWGFTWRKEIHERQIRLIAGSCPHRQHVFVPPVSTHPRIPTSWKSRRCQIPARGEAGRPPGRVLNRRPTGNPAIPCRSLLGTMIYVGGRYVVTATGQFAYRPLAIVALALPRTSSPPALNFGTGQQESEDCRQHQSTTGANSDVATVNQRQAVV